MSRCKGIDRNIHVDELSAFYGFRLLGSLSTHVFETQTATGSKLFSLLTCPQSTTVTMLNIFSPLEISSIKIWEKMRSWHEKCSLQVAVRVSKMLVLKLPNYSTRFCNDDFSSLKSCTKNWQDCG